uniref:Uncharacterized protein n=1 Tax=Arundo donax TaxID=35708 RepID=A0A0A9DLD0_ARUDO
MRDASRRCVLQSTWSMGLTVPSLSPLFWILRMLATLDMRITESVHASVFTVAGPLPVFTWSTPRIASSRSGPTFTISSSATAPSANRTRNSNCIIPTDCCVPLYQSAVRPPRLTSARATKLRFSANQPASLPFFSAKFRSGTGMEVAPQELVSAGRKKTEINGDSWRRAENHRLSWPCLSCQEPAEELGAIKNLRIAGEDYGVMVKEWERGSKG